MDRKEDRPGVYKTEYEFSDINLTGNHITLAVRRLFGIGFLDREGSSFQRVYPGDFTGKDDLISWGYTGDFSAVYAVGGDSEGNPIKRLLYDFSKQKHVDIFNEFASVEAFAVIASAYEVDDYEKPFTLETAHQNTLEWAIEHYRPCINSWTKIHWNNMLMRQQGDGVKVTIVGVSGMQGFEKKDSYPFRQGDFHSKKVERLFQAFREEVS